MYGTVGDPDLHLMGSGGHLIMNVEFCEDKIVANQRKCAIFEKLRGRPSPQGPSPGSATVGDSTL